ncbi:GGDEF domain-containing protein [Celeribacter indicus]|uniref:Diguanylate cyclase n=1 Tax=Celeribacter indicus TaxID=1208324 RepID=A0A0B5E4W2_9RHOB|nr:GGDEF domain-containing protein [Celeribacter indicus]AJE48056.1 diguanylate cyclase [Celeribacter indicus]SDW31084.1 diguanylate cyclase (GGDEF) domain-containing protein [Celeribacter indicus]
MTGGDFALIEAFLPMSLIYDDDGRIVHAGPTLAKLRSRTALEGRDVRAIFSVRDNGRGSGEGPLPLFTRLYLTFREGKPTALKGMAVPLPERGLNVLNLAFGISIVDAVAEYRLTAGDFAHTDLAIEMLYLVEAKSAVLEETKQLNIRLQGAKLMAEEQAYTDILTGLRNRRAMDHVLQRMLRGKIAFAILHLDLDYFKRVNDTFGHAAGDAVLQAVAVILREESRGDDLVARVGGDEFILLFTDVLDRRRLLGVAERIIARLEVPIPYEDGLCRISGSIGITATDLYRHPDADEMIQDADLALYTSKSEGRGRATLFDPARHHRPAAGTGRARPGARDRPP